LPERGAGEIGLLERSFNTMAGSLQESREELAASRARIVAAADQERRRIEPDLQDGTQLTPGDVVLMHFRTDLLVDLQKVFDVCKQQGFAIASLQDYLPA